MYDERLSDWFNIFQGCRKFRRQSFVSPLWRTTLLLRSSYRQSTLFLVSFPNVTRKCEGWIEFPRLLIWLLALPFYFFSSRRFRLLRREKPSGSSLFCFVFLHASKTDPPFWLPFFFFDVDLRKRRRKEFLLQSNGPLSYMLVCLSNQVKKNMKTKGEKKEKSSQVRNQSARKGGHGCAAADKGPAYKQKMGIGNDQSWFSSFSLSLSFRVLR